MTAPEPEPVMVADRMRAPATVMRLSRLGSFHQTRLSFMRSLLRRIASEGWRLERSLFDLDDEGYGTVVYRVEAPAGVCSLVAFSHELAPAERSDRVIAEKWDTTFTLMLGEPTPDDIERLQVNVPKQEAGRVSARECVLSRSNKSVRMFEHVVGCLAHGWQPNIEDLIEVGYLMRTTAVYGNGKFGLSDLPNTFASGLFKRPFEAEMLAVYLIREFTIDLVEHVAAARSPERAVGLDIEHRRALGIGNSTGLGMAPFLINHPTLIHRWIVAREAAIARVLALAEVDADTRTTFHRLMEKAVRHVGEWTTTDTRQAARIGQLRKEMSWLVDELSSDESNPLNRSYPWQGLVDWVKTRCSEEMQELLNSLIIEPYGELVDELVDTMTDPETPPFDPRLRMSEIRKMVEEHYDWALAIDFESPAARYYFWYRSEEKEEPRLGERGVEPGADIEMRLDIAYQIQTFYRELTVADGNESVAEFLLRNPERRFIVTRLQAVAGYPYGEIRDNLLDADCLAIDLLRCKLSFFGAMKFDPRSDRWTRITMFQGAPGFAELRVDNADDWAFPVFLGKRPGLHA